MQCRFERQASVGESNRITTTDELGELFLKKASLLTGLVADFA